jgi:hypothetical protein
MMIVEKNIPYHSDLHRPPNSGIYVAPRKWPWTVMKPGDSFTVLTKEDMRSARNSFYQHRRTVHCKIPPTWIAATKKVSGGMYRLWLIDTESSVTPVDTAP